MRKQFKYKTITLTTKTNLLKNGVAYFGERDVQGELERATKEAYYERVGGMTSEMRVINIFNKLRATGIKPVSVEEGTLSYDGAVITQL